MPTDPHSPPTGPHPRLLRLCERVSHTAGEIGSWIYFIIGVCVVYEVVSRYVFNSPTHWVEEMSRLGMVWGTFLILATCLSRRQLITITIVSQALGPRARFVQELVIFVLFTLLAGVIAWYGIESMIQTISVNRRTNTTLSLPYWIFYLPIVLGFVLFLLQALAEIGAMLLTGHRLKPGFGQEEI
ncbi:TRAP transporter small permease [Salipiger marinus]|uniref:TRAP transporter small permease n=1 Tax=Salipiger marinus TaxID=555512 RepID=UPI001E447D92|nr:TRAP transporter small permease [Salipiger manganoxidans]